MSTYGIIDAEEIRPGVYRIRDLVEKPPRDEAPSDLAIIGRYILTPDIFPALAATVSDRTGEIQLTNGLRHLLEVTADLRLPGRRRPPRHRQQARVPEGGRVLRAATPGPRGAVPRVPPVDRSRARRDDAVGRGLLAAVSSWTPGSSRRTRRSAGVDVLPPDRSDPESVFVDPESLVLILSSCPAVVSDEPDFSDEPDCPPSPEDFFA